MVTALNSVGRQAEARSASAEMSGWVKIARPLLATSVAPTNSRGAAAAFSAARSAAGNACAISGASASA